MTIIKINAEVVLLQHLYVEMILLGCATNMYEDLQSLPNATTHVHFLVWLVFPLPPQTPSFVRSTCSSVVQSKASSGAKPIMASPVCVHHTPPG